MKSKRFSTVLGIVFWVLLSASPVFAAFGISPPFILNDHLLQGSSFEQKIVLSRNEPEEDLKVELEIDAPEINDWITIDKGLSFILPKGQQQTPIQVSINVPKNAELGNYEGKIMVKTTPKKSDQGMVTIALGGEIRIELAVIEKEVADFRILTCGIPYAEEKGLIKFLMKIENMGNVAAAPSKVHLDVYDRYHRKLLESANDTNLDPTEPFKTGEIYAQFSTNLKIDSYWGEIKIFKGDEIIREENIYFNVVERKEISSAVSGASTVSIKASNRSFPYLYFCVGAGIVFFAGLILFFWIKRKKKKDFFKFSGKIKDEK